MAAIISVPTPKKSIPKPIHENMQSGVAVYPVQHGRWKNFPARATIWATVMHVFPKGLLFANQHCIFGELHIKHFRSYKKIEIKEHDLYMIYSAFANSCPLKTHTFLFPLIHSHNILLSSNNF